MAERAKKWAYAFSGGDGKNLRLLGGRGAQPVRDDPDRPQGTAGLRHHHRGLPGSKGPTRRRHGTGAPAHGRGVCPERQTFVGRDNPLLVSVRPGSGLSMPGMMDAIPDLGLNPDTLQGLIRQMGKQSL